MEKRDRCKCFPNRDASSSTYLADRAQLAYGSFALPKLLREMDSDVRLTHWKAVVSLTEFLLNPLNAQSAITEYDIVRKWVEVLGFCLQVNLSYPKQVKECLYALEVEASQGGTP